MKKTYHANQQCSTAYLEARKAAMLHPESVIPQYDGGCFSSLPQNIRYFLTGQPAPLRFPEIPEEYYQQYGSVVFFFIDSFGWEFFEKFQERSPFLKRIVAQGGATKITSQFPSTTSAHVTTIHTGLEVGQSGVFEWQFYEPQLDQIILPLLFSSLGAKRRETLKEQGIAPEQLFSFQTLHEVFQEAGIASHVLQHQEYTPSSYSNVIFRGAQAIPYLTLPEALTHLETLLLQQSTASYFCLYFDRIDSICHRYGPHSPQLEAEVEGLLTTLELWFQRLLRSSLKDTLFILSADHGQMDVKPQQMIYLNQDPAFAGIEQYLQTNQQGDFLIPGGSPRNMILYIKEGRVEEAQAFLQKSLNGRADVHQAQHLIAKGLYGAKSPSATFRARMGDLVILPHPHESVWWHSKGASEQNLCGLHGGLSPQEMEIPLLLYALNA